MSTNQTPLEKLNRIKAKRDSNNQPNQNKGHKRRPLKKAIVFIFAILMTLFGRVMVGIAAALTGGMVLLLTWSFTDFGTGLKYGIYTAIAVFIISGIINFSMEDDTIFDRHEDGKIEADRRDMQKMIDRGDIRK